MAVTAQRGRLVLSTFGPARYLARAGGRELRLALDAPAYVRNGPRSPGQSLRREALALFRQLHYRLTGRPIGHRLDSSFRPIYGPFAPRPVQFEMMDRTLIPALLYFFSKGHWTLLAVGDDFLPTTVAASVQSADHLTCYVLAACRFRSPKSADCLVAQQRMTLPWAG